jgi:ABC-type transporter MlaC component
VRNQWPKRRPLSIYVPVSFLALIFYFLAAPSARADVAASAPMAVVQTAVNQALKIFRDSKTPLTERRRQMRSLLAAHFDFAEMARSALGNHWRALGEDQRKRFVDSFTAFVEYDFLKAACGKTSPFRLDLTAA